MTRYRTKHSIVEAIQWTGNNFDECDLLTDGGVEMTYDGELLLLAGVGGAQGFVPVPRYHWILATIDDIYNCWPVENEYFLNKYEEIDE